MNSSIVIVLAIVAVVRCNDLIKGENNNGTKIFDEKIEASPTVWRQDHNLTVNTTAGEIINKINVTDLRPYKDGEVNIVDGGVGQSTVTFELKSPTVLRGYSFQIEVYADNNNETNTLIDQTNKPRIQRNTSEMPTSNKPKTNSYETKTPEDRDVTIEMQGTESSSLPTNSEHSNPTVQPMVPLAASLDGFGNPEKVTFTEPKASQHPIYYDYPPSEVVKTAAGINNHPRNLRDTEGLSNTEEGNLPLLSAHTYNPPTYNHTGPAQPISVLPINNTRFGPHTRQEYKEVNVKNMNTPTAKEIVTLKQGNYSYDEIRNSSRSGRDTDQSTEQPKIVEDSFKIVPGDHKLPEDPQENKPTPETDDYPGARPYHPTTTTKTISETDDPFADDSPTAVIV